MSDIWQLLQSSFSPDAIEWRVVKIDEGSSQALVKPQLYYQAVIDRLNQIGKMNWSNKYISVSKHAIAAELSINNISKSQVVSLKNPFVDDDILAKDALVGAAALFGIDGGIKQKEYWVDYDLEAKEIVFEPDLEIETKIEEKEAKTEAKSETKEVIDRLVERLGKEGLGLEAAKLLTKYGGYGNNSESAKQLYGNLRELLMNKQQLGSSS